MVGPGVAPASFFTEMSVWQTFVYTHPNTVVKGKQIYTVKCFPYLQQGSWLHHEAVWPHTQLFLKQTHLRNYYTLKQHTRKIEEIAVKAWNEKGKAFSLATIRILLIMSQPSLPYS